MDIEGWRKFHIWSRNEGDEYLDSCMNWGSYGMDCISSCEACQIASHTVAEGGGVIEGGDDEEEEEVGGDAVGNQVVEVMPDAAIEDDFVVMADEIFEPGIAVGSDSDAEDVADPDLAVGEPGTPGPEPEPVEPEPELDQQEPLVDGPRFAGADEEEEDAEDEDELDQDAETEEEESSEEPSPFQGYSDESMHTDSEPEDFGCIVSSRKRKRSGTDSDDSDDF